MNSYFISVGKDPADKILTFIGLKKAFHNVDHEILCKKLAHYGAQQQEDRCWCVVCAPSFLVYINNPPHAVQNSVVSIYSDDTSLCYYFSDIDNLIEAFNNDLIQLENWLKSNTLSLNVAKTNSMAVSTKQKHKILESRNKYWHLQTCNKEFEAI